MNIDVRFLSSDKGYVEVTIEENGTKIDCGLYDKEERKQLAEELQSVIDDLLYELN